MHRESIYAFRRLPGLLWLAVALLFSGGAGPSAGRYIPRNDPAPIQTLVDDLRERLSIPHSVIVEIVPANARLVSVERQKGADGLFRLSLEDGFFDTLTPEEREAVIAHELGHVWIFTTHPYLQTERLANRIAMRVVSQDSLVSVYEKMWAHSGTKGDIGRFLGDGTR